jgi:hypothetical protein
MEQVWQFAGSSKEGEPFEIRGVNVWEQGWQVSPGQEAHVHDPVYGQGLYFPGIHHPGWGREDRVRSRRVFEWRMGVLHSRVSLAGQIHIH